MGVGKTEINTQFTNSHHSGTTDPMVMMSSFIQKNRWSTLAPLIRRPRRSRPSCFLLLLILLLPTIHDTRDTLQTLLSTTQPRYRLESGFNFKNLRREIGDGNCFHLEGKVMTTRQTMEVMTHLGLHQSSRSYPGAVPPVAAFEEVKRGERRDRASGGVALAIVAVAWSGKGGNLY